MIQVPRIGGLDRPAATAQTHKVNLRRILPTLGDRPIDAITADDMAGLAVELSGLRRETLRKTLTTLPQVFDYADMWPAWET